MMCWTICWLHINITDSQVETSVDSAETYCVKTLKTTGDIDDEIMVYGIHEDSRYFPKKLKDGDVLVSDGYADKYRLSDGDEIKLKENYGDDIYKFKLTGSVKYPSTLAIFMTRDNFRQTFGLDDVACYFSVRVLTDLTAPAVFWPTKG